MRIETVDTRHGSLNKQGFSNGNTLPYTGTPFGMNYFVLQTMNDSNFYFDPTYPVMQGVRLTHQPSPWMGDYSWLLFTPLSGKPRSTDLNQVRSSYKVSEAIFQPHILEVKSLQYRLKTTIVPTKRGAKINLTRFSEKTAGLMLTTEKGSEYWIDREKKRLYGTVLQDVNNQKSTVKLHVVLDFDQEEIEAIELNAKENHQWMQVDKVKDKVVWLSIQTKAKEISCSVGTSFISKNQAILNLKREVTPYSIEECRARSAERWENYLNKIVVKDRNHQKVRDFNQYLYRMFLFPQTYYERDENRQPIHFDSYSETVRNGKFYTNNGFWDTYKTVYPLYSLIIPEKYKEILEGVRHFYEEIGHLPKWISPDEKGVMPGTLINAVIADAAVKGLLNDEEKRFFLDALIKEATTESKDKRFGRAGVKDMLEYGYVTNKEVENVNQTSDNAYSDFCIRQIANTLDEKEVALQFEKEAVNYRHLFDEATGFLRGKNEDEEFSGRFVPEDWSYDYTEGSAWQNTLGVYHDIQGHIDLLGGEQNFLDHLTALANEEPIFEIGNYGMEIHEMSEMATADFGQIAISNQPSFHIPYLYTYAGKPKYTQHIVKQLCTHAFQNSFDGYPGDEDNGSMSGWFIFSCLGFYPVTPGNPEYVLGIPQFDEIIIRLPQNKKFTIKVDGNVPQNSFVKEFYLNNKEYDKLYLEHSLIVNGGHMDVQLSLLPVEKKYETYQLPYSLSNEYD